MSQREPSCGSEQRNCEPYEHFLASAQAAARTVDSAVLCLTALIEMVAEVAGPFQAVQT